MDTWSPSLLLMQETKAHQLEEARLDSYLGQKRHFHLNSPDLYTDSFCERLEMTKETPVQGTGLVINTEVAGEKFVM